VGERDDLDPAPCPAHPGLLLVERCAACARPLCIDCGSEHDGRRFCDACVGERVVQADREERSRPRGPSGITVGLLAVLGVGAILGGAYALARPSIERAKVRARARACELALARIHDAARLYAEDHGRLLPLPRDGRVGTLARDLVEAGYLAEAPAHAAPASVTRTAPALDGDPTVEYIVELAPHPSGIRHALRVDGGIVTATAAAPDWESVEKENP